MTLGISNAANVTLILQMILLEVMDNGDLLKKKLMVHHSLIAPKVSHFDHLESWICHLTYS